ncbi:MAG: hypothetical protein GY949_08040 [Gammaproteobacteria bacterium]|nr:hypothetical protein [Gammaproteobacteria bacterium]
MAQPLFESNEPLSIVLELPLKDLLRRAQKKPTVPGVLRYRDSGGTEVVLDVEIASRGKSRLEECSLPPLSINLKRKQVESTLFSGQKKLKLVTQCRGSSVYRRYLNQEFAVYKIYNLLTDYSFRARMLEVTYRDSSGRADKVQPAFFIESVRAVAERQKMTTVNSNVIDIAQLDPVQLSIFALFQFMIGNTDWSARKGPGSESCCHNGKVIAPPDSALGWVVLPYDFDQAGLINTRYSAPSDLLPIKSVRHRLYRGFCSTNAQLESTIAMFNDKRAAIEGVLTDEQGKASDNKTALRYLQGFYEIINDPKKRQKKIVDKCQGRKKR